MAASTSPRENDHGRSVVAAGAVATGVGLALLWAASALVPGIPFPPLVLAEVLVRAVPGGIATFFIELLHHWALRLLGFGVVAGALAGGALALRATVRSDGKPRPSLAAGILVAVGATGLLVQPSSSGALLGIATLGLAGLAYAVVATRVYELLVSEPRSTDLSRRRALGLGLGGALGLALVGSVAGRLGRRLTSPDVHLVEPAVEAVVPDRPFFPDVPGLTPEVTSADDHYVVDINFIPPFVDPERWRLKVFGEVYNPLELTFSRLQRRFEVVEEFSALTCVSNEVGGSLVGNSAWGGVRLRDVLRAAGPKPGGRELVLRAADGYSDSFPLELGMDPTVLLAVSQNGEPLRPEHGFPCRVRIPRLYGMENVKWLESIEVVGADYLGYWQKRGWEDVAVVKTQSRIDVVGEDFSARIGEPAWIAGVAWAGGRGISKVEVSTDGGGSWDEALLKDPLSPNSWVLWAHSWTPTRRGRFAVSCRATDGDGKRQTSEEAAPHPDGASGYHVVTVEVS